MSTLELSIATVAESKCAVPVFTKWTSSDGDVVHVLLHWHPELPQLPNEAETLCTVQLLDAAEADGQQLLEARLQQLHLVPSSGWRKEDVERLMKVMAHQRWQQDELRLRRAVGRMVIDVHFAASERGLQGTVVEILNAYGCLERIYPNTPPSK